MGTVDRTPTIPPPRQPPPPPPPPPETPGRLLKARQRNQGKALSHIQQVQTWSRSLL